MAFPIPIPWAPHEAYKSPKVKYFGLNMAPLTCNFACQKFKKSAAGNIGKEDLQTHYWKGLIINY
jgi:hypothetical protein